MLILQKAKAHLSAGLAPPRLLKSYRSSTRFLPFVFVLATCWSATSLAQAPGASTSLTLFEAIDQDDANPRNQPEPPPRIGGSDTQPAFSLLGTTRIGSRRSVILQHQAGESISLTPIAGTPLAIPEHPGYELLVTEAGAIEVQYPAARRCLPFEALGVRCDADTNRAQLSLANMAPLPPPVTPVSEDSRTRENPEAMALLEQADNEEPPPNPFEVLRARAARGQASDVISGDDQAARFRPRRIDPNQIPPGKRVVSTPFGDRLVDI